MNFTNSLRTFYQTVNPRADSSLDNKQLRADSLSSGLRFRKGGVLGALSRDEKSRVTHTANARHLVARMIDESIQSLVQTHEVPKELVQKKVAEEFFDLSGVTHCPLFLRTVKCVMELLDGIAIQSKQRVSSSAEPARGTDRKALLAQAQRTTSESEVLQQACVSALAEPEEPLNKGAFRSFPHLGAQRSGDPEGTPEKVVLHRIRGLRTQGAAPIPSLSLGTAEDAKAVSRVSAAASVLTQQAATPATRATNWLAQLDTHCTPASLAHWTLQQTQHFQQRLTELVAFADRVLPRNVAEFATLPKTLESAAKKLEVSAQLRPDIAFFMQLTGPQQRRAYGLLPADSKEVIRAAYLT